MEEQTSVVQSPSGHGELLMNLLGIASITLDVESGTSTSGDSSEEPGTMWFVLGIVDNGVSRECMVNCY